MSPASSTESYPAFAHIGLRENPEKPQPVIARMAVRARAKDLVYMSLYNLLCIDKCTSFIHLYVLHPTQFKLLEIGTRFRVIMYQLVPSATGWMDGIAPLPHRHNNTDESNDYTTYEEIHGIADTGSHRRIDIITFKPGETKGYILDPTIRFETHQNQPEDVNIEKRRIYEPSIPYYKTSYKLMDIEVIGLMVGARGTITKQFVSFCHKFGVPTTTIKEISIIALQILRRHLYFNSNCS
ncbi:hypothetical protein ANN_02412 [Periplaneta americana]|uniref:Uncharacterized protein n=1 Tax=Periplaneta americana TaxID=6978 RepID=A0ABQ8TZ70_PERAM|nr:hypothetical protein ANN_02412 [Periplaneta americana]